MPSRSLAALCAIALAVALGGCTFLQLLPPVAGATPEGLPAGKPSPADQVNIRRALDEGAVDANGAPEFEARLLPDIESARHAFPGALFPRFALNRRLVGIVHKVALKDGVQPHATLTLVYEGQLVVAESVYNVPPQFPTNDQNLSTMTTQVAGAIAEVTEYEIGLPGTGRHARARWAFGDMRYAVVDSPDVAPSQVLDVARSMAP